MWKRLMCTHYLWCCAKAVKKKSKLQTEVTLAFDTLKHFSSECYYVMSGLVKLLMSRQSLYDLLRAPDLKMSVDLFSHNVSLQCPQTMTVCGSVGRGAVQWVGLSAPVVVLSRGHSIYLLWLVCPSCWRSAEPSCWSPTLRRGPSSTAGLQPQSRKRGGLCMLTHRQLLGPSFFFYTPTSLCNSYFGRLTPHLLHKSGPSVYGGCEIIALILLRCRI